MNGRKLRDIRGNDIAMIFQDLMTSLNPVHTIGKQLVEAILLHRDVTKAHPRRALELLKAVGIRADRRVDDYPHQFSGGMRQRVMIAMALVNDPDLLIADEPTTALDVTTQAQILELMNRLQREFGSAIIIITHDLGVVAETADDVVVMYAARIAEQGPVDEIFKRPHHPYTWGLLGSLPRLDTDTERLVQIPGQPSLLQPAARLSVPSALSVRDERLQAGGAGAEAGHRRPRSPAAVLARRDDEGPRSCEAPARRHGGDCVVMADDLLVVEDLQKLPDHAGSSSRSKSRRCRPSTASPSASRRARPSASSASRAAASRRWRAASCVSSTRPAAR